MKFVRRRYSRRRVPGPALALCLLVLLLPASAGATNHRIRVEQVMVGANFDVDVQFIEMKFEFPGQNNWSGSPARARLTFHDASGAQTGEFPFPTNPSDSGPGECGPVGPDCHPGLRRRNGPGPGLRASEFNAVRFERNGLLYEQSRERVFVPRQRLSGLRQLYGTPGIGLR
jgi:hypothetical protein